MVEICPTCGLPKELCTCGVREREEKKITVFVEKRRWNKPTTVIDGVAESGKDLSKKLKSKFACGGTFKNGRIELQGDHRANMEKVLVSLGYDSDKIEIV
jgi:translation initiation factor 1